MTDDRHAGQPDDRRTADELRRRLTEQSHHAPAGDFLAERIIAQAEAAQRRGPRSIGLWGRVLAVAAAVIVVAGIGAIVLVVANSGNDRSDNRQVADPPSPTSPAVTAPLTTPAPATSSSSSPTSSPTAQATRTRKITVPTLDNVKIADVTFTGGGNGWAVATADCLSSAGTCSALLHTSDDGKSWQSRPGTPFTVASADSSCTSRCVSHIRFATDKIGYAYSRTALFITTDGARKWRMLDGGADALETLDGNVIKVSSDAASCPPGCRYSVQIADFGSTDWQTVTLPGYSAATGVGVTLSRIGSHAYLLATGNPAGGASHATSTLWTSSDDGASWRNRGEPCTQGSGPDGEVDSSALTTAADGSVVVSCRQRLGGEQALAISTNDGKSFAQGPFALGAAQVTTLGAASSDIALVSSDLTYRTVDAGRHFVRDNGIGQVSYLGFSSGTDAHAIASDGKTIYTTSDAGRSWRAAQFG